MGGAVHVETLGLVLHGGCSAWDVFLPKKYDVNAWLLVFCSDFSCNSWPLPSFCLNTWVLKHLALALWLRANKVKLCLKVQSWSMKIVCWVWIGCWTGQHRQSLGDSAFWAWEHLDHLWFKVQRCPVLRKKCHYPWLYWSQHGPFQVLLSACARNNWDSCLFLLVMFRLVMLHDIFLWLSLNSQWLMVTLKPIFGIKSFDIHQLYLRNWYYFLWWFFKVREQPKIIRTTLVEILFRRKLREYLADFFPASSLPSILLWTTDIYLYIYIY